MKYYIKADRNVRIFVEDINPDCSKTILFIHGWPLNHNAYEYQINKLSSMGYRCIAIDLRGYGKSDRPSQGYDYNTMAKDIRCVIEVLKLNNITLVGHSMGGAISIRYVSNYNAYGVSKLCLIGAAAPSWVKTNNWKYGYAEYQVNNLIQETYIDRGKLVDDVRDSFFFQYKGETFKRWFENLCLAAAGWSTANSLMALRDERLFNDLENINISTLILHGVHDKVCPFEFAKYMDNAIDNSTLIPLTESGHGAFAEEIEKVNNSLVCFINQ